MEPNERPPERSQKTNEQADASAFPIFLALIGFMLAVIVYGMLSE